tara:strand:+ start:355 stop:510 length:156 start_codon:yes stop_codon:yes gene_type:complete
MVWTAIFENRTVKVFSTQHNSYEEAEAVLWELKAGKLFALLKGVHSDVKFF